ncbi:MAG: NAD-dependent epimerase/dehydratase family protein, partial [Acidobacteria bacterium]|nr:NAD-dependent epimerase/dehydratase family protein [Acidobacteriota bacterium]
RQWEINVQGTRHVLETIQRANQKKLQVELFIYLSSVTAYGSNLSRAVREDAPLEGHTLPYAVHKRETDWLCRASHGRLRGCAVYVLRAHIFLGKAMDNFILRAFRGQPSGNGRLARWVSRLGWRLPVILPRGQRYDGLFQFVHVDDVARLLHWICEHYEPGKLEVLNVQGKGQPLSNPECAAIAQARMLRLPSYGFVQSLFRLLWWSGLSGVPPKSLPYFTGSYVMNCDRLKALLGDEYDRIIRFTSEETLRDAFSR